MKDRSANARIRLLKEIVQLRPQLHQMQHRLKYLEQEVEFLKKYPPPEIHASEGRSHEWAFYYLLLDPSDAVRQREQIVRFHDVPDSRRFQIRLLRMVKGGFGKADSGSTESCWL